MWLDRCLKTSVSELSSTVSILKVPNIAEISTTALLLLFVSLTEMELKKAPLSDICKQRTVS